MEEGVSGGRGHWRQGSVERGVCGHRGLWRKGSLEAGVGGDRVRVRVRAFFETVKRRRSGKKFHFFYRGKKKFVKKKLQIDVSS